MEPCPRCRATVAVVASRLPACGACGWGRTDAPVARTPQRNHALTALFTLPLALVAATVLLWHADVLAMLRPDPLLWWWFLLGAPLAGGVFLPLAALRLVPSAPGAPLTPRILSGVSLGAVTAAGVTCLTIGPFFGFFYLLPFLAFSVLSGFGALLVAGWYLRTALPLHRAGIAWTVTLSTFAILLSLALAAWAWWVFETTEWT